MHWGQNSSSPQAAGALSLPSARFCLLMRERARLLAKKMASAVRNQCGEPGKGGQRPGPASKMRYSRIQGAAFCLSCVSLSIYLLQCPPFREEERSTKGGRKGTMLALWIEVMLLIWRGVNEKLHDKLDMTGESTSQRVILTQISQAGVSDFHIHWPTRVPRVGTRVCQCGVERPKLLVRWRLGGFQAAAWVVLEYSRLGGQRGARSNTFEVSL